MQLKLWTSGIAAACLAMMVSVAQAELAYEFISHDGGGSGAFEGDPTGVGEFTLLDEPGVGDMWNGGDQFSYLHETEKRLGDWRATVRVVSQTEALDGRWGKGGLRASHNLTGLSANGMTQVAAGNGSQIDPPTEGSGDHSPVPIRWGGRTQNDGQGGFEVGIPGNAGNMAVDGDGNVANNVFPQALAGAANMVWLRLDYSEADNSYISCVAPDVDGVAGDWNCIEPQTNVPAPGRRDPGLYVGVAYSAHNSLGVDGPVGSTRADGLHGITFDNFSVSVVPEPASIGMLGLGLMGLLGFRRRRR